MNRTGDFFTTLLNLEPGEEPPKSPAKQQANQKPTNGVPASSTEHLPPFYQPPAPPPSQPLPDKPDAAAPTAESLLHSSFKRTETEKAFLPSSSPPKPGVQDSQILHLLDALKTAKQELSSQGDRMRYLETALRSERKARETAERRAKALCGDQSADFVDANSEIDESFEPPLDSLELVDQDLANGHSDSTHTDRSYSKLNPSPSTETLKDHSLPADDSVEPASVQARYELLRLEFDQMKIQMEVYKRKADEAEVSKRRFMDLVESKRLSQSRNDSIFAQLSGPSSVASNDSSRLGSDTATDDTELTGDSALNHADELSTGGKPSGKQLEQDRLQQLPNGSATKGSKLSHELETSLSKVFKAQNMVKASDVDGRWAQSGPYISMVGVVLIGVGIMTYLNGWPAPSGGGKIAE